MNWLAAQLPTLLVLIGCGFFCAGTVLQLLRTL
jgi:hypothetical protein